MVTPCGETAVAACLRLPMGQVKGFVGQLRGVIRGTVNDILQCWQKTFLTFTSFMVHQHDK